MVVVAAVVKKHILSKTTTQSIVMVGVQCVVIRVMVILTIGTGVKLKYMLAVESRHNFKKTHRSDSTNEKTATKTMMILKALRSRCIILKNQINTKKMIVG